MPDPLAAQRQRINEDSSISALTWPDRGRGCPVDVGDVFKLRSASIQITRTRRLREGGRFVWLADFARYRPQRPYLLARGAGDGHGYTTDPDLAVAAQDDPDAATIASVDPLDNPLNLRAAPEPEAVAPDEVEALPRTVAARANYERERAEEWASFERLPLRERLRFLREQRRSGSEPARVGREERRLRVAAKRAGG
jgi:hypothetical protein